jgi:hypothetical protein
MNFPGRVRDARLPAELLLRKDQAMEDSQWREVFIQKSLHEIREIVYDTRKKAAAKKSELRKAVKYFLLSRRH